MAKPKKMIYFRDVALREAAQVEKGEMSPRDQEVYVRYILEDGINGIEIGMPELSKSKFQQCRRTIQIVDDYAAKHPDATRPILSALSVAKEEHIAAVKEVGCDMVHIYIPSKESMLLSQFKDKKYGLTKKNKKEWAIKQAVKMIKYAKSIGFKLIEYSPEGAFSTDTEYLWKVSSAVRDAGITCLNLPCTDGLTMGNEAEKRITEAREKIVDGGCGDSELEISVHFHNDSDHSTHNTCQAILSGATWVEGTFYGLGERSGMTKFEALLMNLHSRQDIFGNFEWSLKRKNCVRNVKHISNAINNPMPRHWVVTGQQNGMCSSGGHQAAEEKAKEAGLESPYYSWGPELYGHGEVTTVINESSGRTGIVMKLSGLGFDISDEHVDAIYERTMKASSTNGGREIKERELVAIAQDVIGAIPNKINVVMDSLMSGKFMIPVSVANCEFDGQNMIASEIGNGCISAPMNAVERALKEGVPELKDVQIHLDDWRSFAIVDGKESSADAYCRIAITDERGTNFFVGRAVDGDAAQASAQAFANCISWYLTSIKKV